MSSFKVPNDKNKSDRSTISENSMNNLNNENSINKTNFQLKENKSIDNFSSLPVNINNFENKKEDIENFSLSQKSEYRSSFHEDDDSSSIPSFANSDNTEFTDTSKKEISFSTQQETNKSFDHKLTDNDIINIIREKCIYDANSKYPRGTRGHWKDLLKKLNLDITVKKGKDKYMNMLKKYKQYYRKKKNGEEFEWVFWDVFWEFYWYNDQIEKEIEDENKKTNEKAKKSGTEEKENSINSQKEIVNNPQKEVKNEINKSIVEKEKINNFNFCNKETDVSNIENKKEDKFLVEKQSENKIDNLKINTTTQEMKVNKKRTKKINNNVRVTKNSKRAKINKSENISNLEKSKLNDNETKPDDLPSIKIFEKHDNNNENYDINKNSEKNHDLNNFATPDNLQNKKIENLDDVITNINNSNNNENNLIQSNTPNKMQEAIIDEKIDIINRQKFSEKKYEKNYAHVFMKKIDALNKSIRELSEVLIETNKLFKNKNK